MNNADSFLTRVFDDPLGRYVVLLLLIVAVIIGVTIFALRISGKVSMALENLFVVRRQVENDHKSKPGVKENMREEITENHENISEQLNRIAKLTLINAEGIATLNSTVGDLTGRVSDIEDTQRQEVMQQLREEIRNG